MMALASNTCFLSVNDCDQINCDYTDNYNDYFSSKGFKFLHLNCRSLKNKSIEIYDLLTKFKPDFLCLTETWCKSETIYLYKLNGYDMFYQCRSSSVGGGIIIYCKDNLNLTITQIEPRQFYEEVTVEIKPRIGQKFYLSCVYRPPQLLTKSDLDYFRNFFEKYSNSDYIILGDFNIDLNNCKNINYTQFIESLNFTQLIKNPTRNTVKSNTLIDHIYCNNLINVDKFGVINCEISDHYLTFITRKINIQLKKCKIKKVINYRKLSKINIDKLISSLNRNNFS